MSEPLFDLILLVGLTGYWLTFPRFRSAFLDVVSGAAFAEGLEQTARRAAAGRHPSRRQERQ